MALPAESQTEAVSTALATEWRWINEPHQMDEIKSDWQTLESSVADGRAIFQTYNWCKIWTNCFVEKHQTGWQIEILTAWEGDKLVLLCPFAVKKHGPVRIAHWLGEPMTQYGTVLIENGNNQTLLLEAMWHQITMSKQFDIARLNYVREDAAISPYLETHGDILLEEEAVALRLADHETFANIEEWYNKKSSRSTRQSRRRAHQALKRLGEPSFAMLSEPDQTAASINDILAFKAEWLKKNGLRSSTFADPVVIDLLHDLMTIDGRENIKAHLYRLNISEQTVAYDIGFSSFGRYVQHIGAFSPNYRRVSPGNFLMEQSMEQLCDNDMEWFDLMAPAYDYKLKWGSHVTKIRSFGLSVNWRGHLYLKLYLERIRPGIKHTLDNLPLPLKRIAKKLQDHLRK